jgi:hypothetical protein
MIEHKSNCASVTQLLLCDPPKPAPCDCGAEKLYTASWSIPEPISANIPNTITFYAGNPKEVMRIERDFIWVNPDVEINEAAMTVLEAMEGMLAEMLRKEWNAAIDAAADVYEKTADDYGDYYGVSARDAAITIRELRK